MSRPISGGSRPNRADGKAAEAAGGPEAGGAEGEAPAPPCVGEGIVAPPAIRS